MKRIRRLLAAPFRCWIALGILIRRMPGGIADTAANELPVREEPKKEAAPKQEKAPKKAKREASQKKEPEKKAASKSAGKRLATPKKKKAAPKRLKK